MNDKQKDWLKGQQLNLYSKDEIAHLEDYLTSNQEIIPESMGRL